MRFCGFSMVFDGWVAPISAGGSDGGEGSVSVCGVEAVAEEVTKYLTYSTRQLV